jgi:OOP family OmpA-OmpF porin
MKRFISVSVLAASLVSGAALAQVGPYAGGSIGQANYSIDCSGNCDKTDIGFKLFGGYMFTPYIGVEADYGWYGTAKINTNRLVNGTATNIVAEAKSDGFSGWVVGQFPIDQFRLFGKLGFARMNTDVNASTATGLPYTLSNNDPSFQFAWGLGGTWMLDKNIGFRAEYEARKLKWESQNNTLGFWSIGAQYHF